MSAVAALLARYLSVGVTCAVVHNIVVIGTTLLGLHYVAALVLSFAITTPLGYLLHSAHTFGVRLAWDPFARFAGGLATGFALSFAIMAVLCSGLGLAPALATPIATVLLFAWNYAVAHWAIARGA